MNDPTNDLLRKLEDPRQYVRKDRVAVFRAHERRDEKGKLLYRVTDSDLAVIAANSNKPYEAGHLARFTIGHTKPESDIVESKQPSKHVGYVGNFKAQLVSRPGGPMLVITQTEYAAVEHVDELAGYPYRSVEYHWPTKQIHGCAALIKSPYLQTGVVQYAATDRAGDITHYSTGVPIMASEKDPTDDEKDEMEYARFSKHMARYEAWKADEAKKAEDAANTANNESTAKPVEYAALNGRLASLEAERAADRKLLIQEKAARLLDRVAGQVRFNYERELGALVNCADDKARESHVVYMLENYQRLPDSAGGFIPTGGVPAPVGRDKAMTREEMNKALDLAARKSVPAMQAYEDIRAGRTAL